MAHAAINFISDALRRPISIDVIFPTDKMVSPTKKIPVKAPMKTFYFLEGSSGNHHRLLTHTLIEPMAEDANVCVVVIGGEDKWYGNSRTTCDFYSDMVWKDLVNFTRATFNLSDKREDTWIGGFSMGGFGAMVIGLQHPDIFGKIAVHSPALCKELMLGSFDEPGHDNWTKKNYETMFGFRDISELTGSDWDYDTLAERVAHGEYKPEILITAGVLDGLHKNCKDFAAKLKDLGFDVTFKNTEGNHNWCVALNEGLKDAMEWFPTDDFGNNFYQTAPESNYEWPDFFIWRCHYNTIDGVASLPLRMKGAKELEGYRLETDDGGKARH